MVADPQRLRPRQQRLERRHRPQHGGCRRRRQPQRGRQGNNLAAARYAAAGGAATWSINLNGTANLDEAAYDITADASDNPCVAGFLYNASGFTAYGTKLAAASGATTWSQTVNGTSAALFATDAFFSVRILNTDVLFGGTQSGTTTNADIGITRVSAAGTLQETTTFNGMASNQDDSLNKNLLAVSGTSVAIGGDTENATPSTDGITLTYTVAAPPITTVTSLNLVNTNPSNLRTVNWTLTFAAADSGVTSSNFSLSGTAASGATVGPPTTSDGGLDWNVPVTTVGDGTLTLSLANATGLSLGVSTTLPFAGQTYTIDTTPPTIVSINRLTPTGQTTASNSVTFRVTYSEPVTVPGTTNFAVVAVNGSSIVGTVTSITGTGTTRDVTVSITSGTGEFRLRGVN